jgi:hypothetical protein
MERTFFFLGFCLPSVQAVWRGFNSDSVLRKLFSGDMDFRKTETNLFLDFVRAEEGSGEESARAFLKFPCDAISISYALLFFTSA